jgi:hypothetical protein
MLLLPKMIFKKRLDYNDKLVLNIMKQKWNIFLKDVFWVKEIIN